MFRTLKNLFASDSPEHAYLAERLQSAKWLGWDARSADDAAGDALEKTDAAAAEVLLALPASRKPA